MTLDHCQVNKRSDILNACLNRSQAGVKGIAVSYAPFSLVAFSKATQIPVAVGGSVQRKAESCTGAVHIPTAAYLMRRTSVITVFHVAETACIDF